VTLTLDYKVIAMLLIFINDDAFALMQDSPLVRTSSIRLWCSFLLTTLATQSIVIFFNVVERLAAKQRRNNLVVRHLSST
jgi:hypothetical protein